MSASRTVTICNRRGLHARAAAKFVAAARDFQAAVYLRRDEDKVPATSIMDLLMLAAGQGSEVTIEAEGPDADAAAQALGDLVDCGFEETD